MQVSDRSDTSIGAACIDHVDNGFIRNTRRSQVADFIGLPGLTLSQAYSEDVGQNTMGHFIWSSGIVLARKLRNKHANDLNGASVLELGCGTGAGLHPHAAR
jgi:hypothetical protein